MANHISDQDLLVLWSHWWESDIHQLQLTLCIFYIYIYIIVKFIYESYSINKGNFFEKSKIHFFFRIFFYKCKFCIIWDWLIEKNYFNLAKIFWDYSKWWAIKLRASDLDRGMFIKFLVAEKCKSCEIYRRMYVEYGETYFIQKCSQMS